MSCTHTSASKRSMPLGYIVLPIAERALDEQHWNTLLGRWRG